MFFGQKTPFSAKKFPFSETDRPWRGGVPPFSVNFFPLTFRQNLVRGGPGGGGYPPNRKFPCLGFLNPSLTQKPFWMSPKVVLHRPSLIWGQIQKLEYLDSYKDELPWKATGYLTCKAKSTQPFPSPAFPSSNLQVLLLHLTRLNSYCVFLILGLFQNLTGYDLCWKFRNIIMN